MIALEFAANLLILSAALAFVLSIPKAMRKLAAIEAMREGRYQMSAEWIERRGRR